MLNYNYLITMLKMLHASIQIGDLADDLKCSDKTIARRLEIPGNLKRKPQFSEDLYIKTFFKYKRLYFGGHVGTTMKRVLEILAEFQIDLIAEDPRFSAFLKSPEQMTEDAFRDFLKLLSCCAMASYTDNPVVVRSPDAEQPVRYCTYTDLRKEGITAENVAMQILENDRVLYGDIGRHAGSVHQWEEHILFATDRWGFLCSGSRIIGNWSVSFLTPAQEESLSAENVYGEDLTAGASASALSAGDGEVAIHLMNLSVNDGYQEHLHLLWESFGRWIHQLVLDGFFFRSITASVFRSDHEAEYRKMGFRHLKDCDGHKKIYKLDLTGGLPEAFRKIMPNVNLEEAYEAHYNAPIAFRQLSQRDELTEQQLSDISSLIYHTDKYIYPALMSYQQAKAILPGIIESNKDKMFNLDNLFVAEAGNGRIIGLILHKRGSLHWDSGYLKRKAEFLGETLPDSFSRVEEEYFKKYNQFSQDSISILNFCIHPAWRSQTGIGTRMMASFLKEHSEEMQLYVLRETRRAVRIYERSGFEMHKLCEGFSVTDTKPPCGLMVRPAKTCMHKKDYHC